MLRSPGNGEQCAVEGGREPEAARQAWLGRRFQRWLKPSSKTV